VWCAPSPKGESWDDDCMDAGGRAMQEQLPRGIWMVDFDLLTPTLSSRRGSKAAR